MKIVHLFNKNKRKTKQGKQNKVKMKPYIEEGMFLLASRLDKEDYEDSPNSNKRHTTPK